MRLRISVSAGWLKTKELPRSPGHALEDQRQRRLVEDEGIAEVAGQCAGEEQPILLPHRLIEPEGLNDLQAFGRRRRRAEEHVDRIADEIKAHENQNRHHQ